MDKDVRVKLLEIKNQIDELLNEGELQFIGTFYGDQGKYELYLFPKSTEKCLNWYDAKEHCKLLGGELPTIGELQYIFDNDLSKTFEQCYNWSSIEHSSTKAYSYFFFNGFMNIFTKDHIFYVRPVKRYYI